MHSWKNSSPGANEKGRMNSEYLYNLQIQSACCRERERESRHTISTKKKTMLEILNHHWEKK